MNPFLFEPISTVPSGLSYPSSTVYSEHRLMWTLKGPPQNGRNCSHYPEFTLNEETLHEGALQRGLDLRPQYQEL